MSSNLTHHVLASKKIIDSFHAREFIPVNHYFGLTKNPHYQTIVGSEALRLTIYGHYPRYFETITERYHTEDNDFFDVEFVKIDISKTKGLVILCHGLESNPRGPLMTKMAEAFLSKGFSVALISFRGCNGDANLTPGAYHFGFTKDLNQFVTQIHQRYPEVDLYLSGFSLGGNVVLKYLGELGENALNLGIVGASVSSVPFDAVQSHVKIDTGLTRIIYATAFLSTLKNKAERQILEHPDSFDIDGVRKAKKLSEFDDSYIAKIYGYEDRFDYYRQNSSKWFLSKIRVPTIAINAIDDPLVDESSLPTEDDIGDHSTVRIVYHKHGGHCGFVGTDESYKYPGKEEIEIPRHGWLADEMAAVIEHIYSQKHHLKQQ